MPKFHFGFLTLCLTANVLIEGNLLPLFYLLVALLHECGHLLAFKAFTRKIKGLQFVGFGIRIDKESHLTYFEETIVSFAGPLINVIFGTVFILFHKYLHRSIFLIFANANFAYAILNLLPLSPLDGYKVLKDVILYHFEFHYAKNILLIMHILSAIISSICLIMLLIFRVVNPSLICVMLILLINSVFDIIRREI